LIAEKEQLLRELRSISMKGRSSDEISAIHQRILQLERDLWEVIQLSNQQLANVERSVLGRDRLSGFLVILKIM